MLVLLVSSVLQLASCFTQLSTTLTTNVDLLKPTGNTATYGQSVATSYWGTTLVVAAPNENTNGLVYIYRRPTEADPWSVTTKVHKSGTLPPTQLLFPLQFP